MSRRAALRTPRLPSSARSLVIGSRKARVDACAWVWCLAEVLWSRRTKGVFAAISAFAICRCWYSPAPTLATVSGPRLVTMFIEPPETSRGWSQSRGDVEVGASRRVT